ncbi:MAG: hypothetical protein ABIH37_05845 [archaeon]
MSLADLAQEEISHRDWEYKGFSGFDVLFKPAPENKLIQSTFFLRNLPGNTERPVLYPLFRDNYPKLLLRDQFVYQVPLVTGAETRPIELDNHHTSNAESRLKPTIKHQYHYGGIEPAKESLFLRELQPDEVEVFQEGDIPAFLKYCAYGVDPSVLQPPSL